MVSGWEKLYSAIFPIYYYDDDDYDFLQAEILFNVFKVAISQVIVNPKIIDYVKFKTFRQKK